MISPFTQTLVAGVSIKNISIFLLIFFSFSLVQAQLVDMIQLGETKQDSSYYDIFQTNDTEFWIGGKGGILKKYTLNKGIQDIAYPKEGNSILRINRMGEKMILAADKGTLFILENQVWKVQKFPNLRKSCFYDIQVIDSLNAFLCGGKSKIAVGKKTIPFGFILGTTDGGETWTTVYKSWKRMIWRLKWEKEKNKLYALTYSPWGTVIMEGKDRGVNWQKTGFTNKNLLHDFELKKDNSFIAAGGNSGSIHKSNSYLLKSCFADKSNSPNNADFYPNVGLIWDYSDSQCYETAGACAGNLLYKTKKDSANWKTIQLSNPINLYEILFYTDYQALIIGSNKSILRLSFPETELNESILNSSSGSR